MSGNGCQIKAIYGLAVTTESFATQDSAIQTKSVSTGPALTCWKFTYANVFPKYVSTPNS